MTVTKDTVFTVYAHVNKTTGMTYIGVTSQKPEKRWKRGNGYKYNSGLYNDIIKYSWNGFDHLILAITKEKTTAGILEQKLIEKYQALGLSYNLESGGYEGYTQADSSRKKIGKAKSGFKNLKVQQIDKHTGEVVRDWNSISDAAKSMGLRVNQSHISDVCQGKRKSAIGYIWKYLN